MTKHVPSITPQDEEARPWSGLGTSQERSLRHAASKETGFGATSYVRDFSHIYKLHIEERQRRYHLLVKRLVL